MTPDGLLKILMLGPPAVRQNDQLIEIPRKQTRGLLFYLACQPGPVTRDELVDLFFEDEDEISARRHLTEAITKLRGALFAPIYVITNPETVELDARLIHSDVVEFNRLIHGDGRPAGNGNRPQLPAATFQRLSRAVDLWRQPARFLSGVRLPEGRKLDVWLTQTSEELERDLMTAITQLADHLAADGELQTAIERLQLGLNLDPTNAGLNIRKLRCLIQSGNIKQAAEYANYVTEKYDDEGIYLPGDLAEVMQQVLTLENQPVPELHPNWEGLVQAQNKFMGQEEALEDLKRAYQRGGAALILGEAGSGKSRLVYEFVRRQSPQPRQLLALCRPLEENLPLQPWVDLLRRHVQPSEWQSIEAAWLKPLVHLLPDLAILRPELKPEQDADNEFPQTQFFEALHQVLLSLASRQRVVLFVDGAQWGDEATYAALVYLLERDFFNKNGLLILAVRPQESNPSLEKLRNASNAGRSLTAIDMRPLNLDEITQVARSVLGQPPTQQLAFRLKMDSGGNPYYLLELLYALQDLHVDMNSPYLPEALPSSGSLIALIQTRMQQLPPQSREVLEAAAVIGKRFTLDHLQAVARLPMETTAEALTVLIQARLIREMPEARPAGGYGFVHDITQEATRQSLLRPRRQVLHRRLALALESSAQPQTINLEKLAYHWEEAGDLQKAFNYWFENGKNAEINARWQEAKNAFKRADRLREQLGDALADQQVYLLYRWWCGTFFYTIEIDQLRLTSQKLFQAGEQRSSALMMGCALRCMADADAMEHQPAQGLVNIERAMTYLEPIQDYYELVEAQSCRGLCLWQLGRYRESLGAWTAAARLSENQEPIGTRSAGLFARIRLAIAYARLGWPRKAETEARKIIQESLELRRPVLGFYGRNILAGAQDRMGQHYMALEITRSVLAAARENHNPGLVGNVLFVMAATQTQLGRLDDAWETITTLLDNVTQIEFVDIIKLANLLRGDIFRLLEFYPAAVKNYQDGLGSTLSGIYTLENLLGLGTTLLMQGEGDLGHHFLERVINEAQAQELNIYQIEAELVLTYAQILSGEIETAALRLEPLERQLAERELTVLPCNPDKLHGLMALQRGEHSAALALGQACLNRGIERQNPWLQLEGLELCLAAAPKEEAANWQQQIEALLNWLDSQTRHAELRPAFANFQKRVLERIK